MRDALLALPINREVYFSELWKNNKIRFAEGRQNLIDRVDKINAQILCTAIERKLNTLIILPDQQAHRPAVAFSTVLVKLGLSCIKNNIKAPKVLFIGRGTQFKHAIGSTYIGNLAISKAFSYTEESKKGNKETGLLIPTDRLPKVICIYNPFDALHYIRKYQPKFILLDCGTELEFVWLEALFNYCNDHNHPVFGFSNNCFTRVSNYFEKYGGSVLYFPYNYSTPAPTSLQEIFFEQNSFTIHPIIIEGKDVYEVDFKFIKAKQVIKSLHTEASSRLKADAVKLCWKLIKTLEILTIPINYFNAGVSSFWNIYSIEELRSSVEKYAENINKTDKSFSNKIDHFISICSEIEEIYNRALPPYWHALSEICCAGLGEHNNVVILFQTHSQKQLFSYALLSKCNISEDELYSDSRVILKTLKEFSYLYGTDDKFANIHPILIGIPDSYSKIYLYRILPSNPDVLILPNQISSLEFIIKDFNNVEKDYLKKNIKTIKKISCCDFDVSVTHRVNRVKLSSVIQKINIETNKVNEDNLSKTSLLNVGNLEIELSSLFEVNIEDENNTTRTYSLDDELSQKQLIISGGFDVYFEEGYKITLGENDQVNIIRANKLDSIYVKGLSKGMSLLLVENQARNNLYDLIISRVHNHPSLVIHMGFLKKWKAEFTLGYMLWKQSRTNSSVADFFKSLQTLGSDISTIETIKNWINGITLRPHDVNDILRVGKILKSKFIIENYKTIFAAATRIVGIHISLSRKLNDLLQHSTDINNRDADLIDEELGLTFGELMSSVKVLKVKDIKRIEASILAINKGKLEKTNHSL